MIIYNTPVSPCRIQASRALNTQYIRIFLTNNENVNVISQGHGLCVCMDYELVGYRVNSVKVYTEGEINTLQ